ncbi:MAG: OmpA family protein [Draconibacterium sp.]
MKFKPYILLLLCLFPGIAICQKLEIFEDVVVEVVPFRFNTTLNEFGPTLVGDTLYYPAMFENITSGKSSLRKEFYSYFNIKKVYLDERGKLLSNPAHDFRKSSKYHDGPLCYNPLTGYYFITRSGFDNARKENLVFRKKIVELKLDIYNPSTRKSEPFLFNSNKYSVAHPAISQRGDTLFFASDMPGGFGGKDLYYSVYINGTWREPKNMGAVINTEFDEVFPSVHKSGAFFFASDRPGGIGGLDIYASKLKSKGQFSIPFLMADSINSTADDFGLTFSDSGKYGFFSSNRAGNGDDDLYQVFLDKQTIVIEGVATDSITGELIAGVSLELIDESGTLIKTLRSGIGGSYEFEILKNKIFKIKAEKKNYRNVTREITYNSPDANVQLEGLYELELTVTSVDKDIFVNDFKVINSTDGSTWNGKNGIATIYLAHNKVNSLLVGAEGFLYQRINVSTRGLQYGLLEETVQLYPFVVDKAFELKNIYYALDKWDLTEASKLELNKLVSLMKENPEIKVDLNSHTDSRGSDQYNLVLSQKRSQSCEKYLIECGIPTDRIDPHGYGETQLINKCRNGVNCPEEMHQANRRTEIKFDTYFNKITTQARILEQIRKTGNRFFIIGKTFQNKRLAQLYFDEMKIKGFNTLYMGEIERNVIYVALEGFTDLEVAKTYLDEIKEKDDFSDVWLFDYGR